MLNFIIGVLCGVWIYKLYREYQTRERHSMFLKKAIDAFRRINRANKGPN